MQIYASLEGVEQDKIETVFKPMSVDIKFHDVQGKNFRYTIPKLNKEIVPEKSKVVVKPNKAVITLFKASKGNWLDLHFKEDKVISNLRTFFSLLILVLVLFFLVETQTGVTTFISFILFLLAKDVVQPLDKCIFMDVPLILFTSLSR